MEVIYLLPLVVSTHLEEDNAIGLSLTGNIHGHVGYTNLATVSAHDSELTAFRLSIIDMYLSRRTLQHSELLAFTHAETLVFFLCMTLVSFLTNSKVT